MSKYRVFISYSHEDFDLAQKIAAVISSNGLIPMWDKDFQFGRGFQDQIKMFIAHSHVFLPVITKSSCERGWVHQEIGYAMALNVPVLPVTIGAVPGEMIRELHAVQLTENIREIRKGLPRNIFDNLVAGQHEASFALFQRAALPEDRSIMMAKYANSVLELEGALHPDVYDCVRQKGRLSSFHIPDKPLDDPIWDQLYGSGKSEYHCRCVLDERVALEKHARQRGCRLIINPYLTDDKLAISSQIVRLKSLAEFLETHSSSDVQVAINCRKHNETVTIVGDWFVAESVTPVPGHGYRQTIFTRHAPTIERRIATFDKEFKNRLKELGWTPESSRSEAIKIISGIIGELERENETKSD